jgi:hypothetical protein
MVENSSEIRFPVSYTRKRLPTLEKDKMDHLSDLYVYPVTLASISTDYEPDVCLQNSAY